MAQTPQYNAVMKNFNPLVDCLVLAKAEHDLCTQFKIHGWLGAIAPTMNADGLIQLALNRIANDVKDYNVFIEMLNAVAALSGCVEKITDHASGAPNLPQLIKLNIPGNVGIHFKYFGIFLLNDGNGAKVNNIAQAQGNHGDPEAIVTAILVEWLAGKGVPVTLDNLIKALRDCQLNTLADTMESRPHTYTTLSGGTHKPGGFEQPDGLPDLRKRTHPEQDLLWKLLCFTDWMRLNDDLKPSKPAKKLFVESKKYLWPQGKRLQVKFLSSQIPAWRKDDGSGNCISTDDILAVANEWHQCGVDAGVDVVPEFVHYKQGKSDIRVEFSENGGAYSLVGTDAEDEVANNHTMCLNLSPTYLPYKYVIRHEFGHALGLQHEHQSPNAPQQFNKEELVKYLKNTYGWNDEQAESQIESQWEKLCESPGQLKSPYDKNSIMHYLIPPNPGVRPADYDGPIENPVELSETDKKMIVKFYSEDSPAAHPASKKMLNGEPVVHGDEVDTGEITGNEQGATGLQTKMLDKISDVDAEKISRYINKWEPLAPYLELGESERGEIRREGDYADQKRKLMSLWIEKKGKKATYSAFIDAAREAGKINLADNVEELLCTKKS